MTENVVTVYRRAADQLEEGGWVAGLSWTATKSMCTGSAINVGAHRNVYDSSYDLMAPFAQWLRENRPEQIADAYERHGEWCLNATCQSALGTVQHWNDFTPGLTGAKVVATLRECADKLEAEHG